MLSLKQCKTNCGNVSSEDSRAGSVLFDGRVNGENCCKRVHVTCRCYIDADVSITVREPSKGMLKYVVSIVEHSDSVVVGLRSFDSVRGAGGSTGTYPGYEVAIRKRDLKVVRSNYIR